MAKRGRGRPFVETLTPAQKRLLVAIETFIDREGMSPTLRELSTEIGQGLASVFKRIERMERNGFVSRQAGKARSLVVLRPSDEAALVGLTPVPLLGTVAAGIPIFSPENQLGEVLVDAARVRSGRHFALKVSGQSMINAGIKSGDVLIVRQQPLAHHKEIVVALLNDEATVKRLHHRNGEIELHPENPKFKVITIGPDDDFRIVGKVVAVRQSNEKN